MRASFGKTRSIAVIGLWAAGLIPVVLSCWAWGYSPKPTAVAQGPKLHSLAFDLYVLDLRHAHQTPRDMHYFYFPFRNVGDKPIKITSMQGSCGCLHPVLDKKDSQVYEAGESGEILLRVHAASQDPGEKEFWVDVKYEDPEPRERRVTLKMSLPKEQVWLQPKALVFYPGRSGGEIPPQEVNVADLRGTQLKIVGVSCDDPYLKYEFIQPADIKTEESASSVGKILITLKTPVPAGRRNAVVKIYTDDPEGQYQELRIPVMINAPEVTAEKELSAGTE